MEKSKCCNVTFIPIHSFEGTSYYSCDKCGNACDIQIVHNEEFLNISVEDTIKLKDVGPGQKH